MLLYVLVFCKVKCLSDVSFEAFAAVIFQVEVF
jgi:hypothetical protein